jgi:hypothetical protein
MSQLYKDEGLREKLSKNAVQQAQKFTWDKAAEVLWENIVLCQQATIK